MSRFFNTAGPVRKKMHYCISPLERMNLEDILTRIRREKYFVLHAPRQTGKTSYLKALMEHLNREGQYRGLYANIEAAQAARANVKEGIKTVLRILANEAFLELKDSFLKNNWKNIFEESGPFYGLQDALMQWCRQGKKPVVLFIDEVDSLVGDTLISLLRQLRAGYDKRPDMFPQSVILCGVRDVKDYRMHSDIEKVLVTGGSAFNIKDQSLKLGNFSLEEIKALYRQHTGDTGQTFEEAVCPLVWELTGGQPWLVNGLAHEACFVMDEGRDRSRTVTTGMIYRAKENLILRRDSHLDQLADKLKEERVRRVIEPLLTGSEKITDIPDDDIDYAFDLGLIKKSPQLSVANPIYREVIPRQLTYATQLHLAQESQWYLGSDGRLDLDKLLSAFRDFFRKHFESWADGFQYREAGPQLLLQAFLQRIVNGGGRVEREYGLGLKRTDLLLIWPYPGGVQEVVIELKIRYGALETTINEGLEQTREYMDKCGTGEGYLLIFDRSPKKTWDEKIFKEERTVKNTRIKIYGM